MSAHVTPVIELHDGKCVQCGRDGLLTKASICLICVGKTLKGKTAYDRAVMAAIEAEVRDEGHPYKTDGKIPVVIDAEGATMTNLQKSAPDYGTVELHKRHSVVLEGDSRRDRDGADSHHARVTDQRVIDRLWRNGRITGKQRWAARKLLGSFTRAGMEARLIVQLGAQRGGTGRSWSPAQLEARDDTNAALKAIAPLNDVVWDVVLADKGLVEVEISRRWNRGTAWIVLDMGLDSLATYYEAHEKRLSR